MKIIQPQDQITDQLANPNIQDRSLFRIEDYNASASVRFLPRQTTTYSCGPASISAAALLLGLNIDEASLARQFGSKPVTGTCHHIMLEWCEKNLPVTSHGENSYTEGLAIANIINPFTGNGHYVVILGIKDSTLRYYCPLVAAVISCEKSLINWSNKNGDLKNWSINLDCPHDFYHEAIKGVSGDVLITI